MKRGIVASLMGVALAAACGCASTAGVWVDKGKLHVEDPAFASNVEVIREIREKTPEGFLHAQVEVKNTNRTDYECQYRFEWIRANGMTQMHAEMPWRPVTLLGRTPRKLEGVCTVKDAEDFRIFIRRAERPKSEKCN